MPMQITTPEGHVLFIRTHVGAGFTVVEVWEEQPAPEQPMDTSGDEG